VGDYNIFVSNRKRTISWPMVRHEIANFFQYAFRFVEV
jgi:hypothetical protein